MHIYARRHPDRSGSDICGFWIARIGACDDGIGRRSSRHHGRTERRCELLCLLGGDASADADDDEVERHACETETNAGESVVDITPRNERDAGNQNGARVQKRGLDEDPIEF